MKLTCVSSDWYEPFAIMAVEEVSVIGGMLVGLNVIDCNLCLKGEDLDKQAGHATSSNVNLLNSFCYLTLGQCH